MSSAVTKATTQLFLEPATSVADEEEVPAHYPLVLERLPPGDLYNARLVCHDWNGIATELLKVTHLFPKAPFMGRRTWEAHVDLEKYGLECEQQEVPRLFKKREFGIFKQMENNVESEQGISFVTLPKGLSLRKLIQFAADPKKGNATKIHCPEKLLEKIGDVEIEKTVTVALTNGPFIGTRGPDFCTEQPVINMRHNCSTPEVLPFLALAVLRLMSSNAKEPVRILNEDPVIYIRCKEMIGERDAVLGDFDQEGLKIHESHPMGMNHYALGGQRVLENLDG